MHQRWHQVFESHWVSVEQRRENGAMFSPIPSAIEQNLAPQLAHTMKGGIAGNTSTILTYKDGFLMYKVEVRKVRHQMSISFLPDSSRLLGL